jgi:hypothetical protein
MNEAVRRETTREREREPTNLLGREVSLSLRGLELEGDSLRRLAEHLLDSTLNSTLMASSQNLDHT